MGVVQETMFFLDIIFRYMFISRPKSKVDKNHQKSTQTIPGGFQYIWMFHPHVHPLNLGQNSQPPPTQLPGPLYRPGVSSSWWRWEWQQELLAGAWKGAMWSYPHGFHEVHLRAKGIVWASSFWVHTHLKFNSSPLKNDDWKMNFLLGFGQFSGSNC